MRPLAAASMKEGMSPTMVTEPAVTVSYDENSYGLFDKNRAAI
jgi:hypothetical protein